MWRICLFLCMVGLKVEAVINRSEYKCSNTTFSPNSTYNANLQLVLSSLGLKTNANQNGFYSSSAGQSSADRVFSSFICRGDVNGQGCEECVADAIKNSNQICPNQKEAIIWYDDCMLRYSNKSFFSIMQVEPNLHERNGEKAEESDLFMNILNQTVNYLAFKVVKEYNKPKMSSAAARYYATKEAKAPAGKRIYTFAQCTPDISADNCSICLQKAISHLSQCCSGKIGGRILQPSCFLRYEIYPFYHSSRKVSGSRHKIVAIAASTSTVTVLLICALFYWVFTVKMVKKDLNAMNEAIVFSELSSADSLKFGLSTIQAATNNFSDNNKLGEGGFGAVYRGMLPNGQEIAAKRLSKNSLQGSEEFMNEVESVTKLQHRNLVRLLGICFEGEEKILVYEFVPNRSLDYFLFDAGKKEQLDWPTRYKIIAGIVRGLLYLHEDSRLKIIHRDLKASNVLLDAHMNPKISDFGTARIFGVDQIQGSTKRIVGTYGYMSPEYVTYGNFSVKSDVFSFGVLILEIISGNRNSSSQSEYGEGLLSIAWKYWREGLPLKLMDPKIKESCSTEEVMRCIHIGLLCVQEDMEDRPTMASVVAMLTSDTISLPLPRQPAFTISCLPMPWKPAFTHSSGKAFDTAYSPISFQNTY